MNFIHKIQELETTKKSLKNIFVLSLYLTKALFLEMQFSMENIS